MNGPHFLISHQPILKSACCVLECEKNVSLSLGIHSGGWCADHRWRPEKALREGMRSVYCPDGKVTKPRKRQMSLFEEE